jgi:Protein of unknown function (DUF3124)
MPVLRLLLLAVTAVTVIPSGVCAQGRPKTDLKTEFQAALTALPDAAALTARGAIYVPAYSNIRAGSRRTRIDLSATLAIHNTSDQKPLVIDKIEYFDSAGKLVERFLDAPVALKPFGTIEVFIAADDNRGGSGANFIVSWAGNGPIAEPLAETVMIGTVGTTSYSFVSQGRPIRIIEPSR